MGTRGAGPRVVLSRGAAARGRYGLTLLSRGECRLSPLPCPALASHLLTAEVPGSAGTGRCAAGVQEPHYRPRDTEGAEGSLASASPLSGGTARLPSLRAPGQRGGCACRRLPVPSSQASGGDRASLPGPCGSCSGKRDVCLACD